MKSEITLIKDQAQTIHIQMPDGNYGIFCFNSKGDLFLNSDYGMYGYAWRHYGDNFKDFLASLNADYVYGKFDSNARYLMRNGLPKHTKKPVTDLITEFIEAVKALPKDFNFPGPVATEFSEYEGGGL